MKTAPLLALLTIAALSSPARLAAQCIPQMNISVYSDGDVSADGSTVYGYTTTVDNSTLCTCTHSDYQTTALLQTPEGAYVGNTEAGLTSSVSTPTDGDEGTYYASGVVSLYCSCYGPLTVAGPSNPIAPPAPAISGVADSVTWSNTIYQSASGYLAIFGTTLTAWGGTPTPTVWGDGAVTIGPVSYASDTQVNVPYTVAANAAIGPHTISLQTARGAAQGTVQAVAPAITSSNPLWFFGIGNTPPSTFTMGDIKTTLTASGPGPGPYTWTVTAGAPEATFTSGSYQPTITTAGNSVTLYSLSFGTSLYDVTVSASWNNGSARAQIGLTIDSPYLLVPQGMVGPEPASSCVPLVVGGGTGWHSKYTWLMQSRWGNVIAGQSANEAFTALTDVQPNNWADFNAVVAPGQANASTLNDNYCNVTVGGGAYPNTSAPQTPLGTSLVDYATQYYSIGSTTIGGGVEVQIQTLSHYIDHASVTNVQSPVR